MPLLATQSFTSAITDEASSPIVGLTGMDAVGIIAEFTATSGGTTANATIQTSLDGGATWYDIARFQFTTSSAVKRACCDGRAATAPAALVTLSSETKIDGLLGDRLRLLTTTTGTYGAGSKLDVYYQAH